ncbi:MAG TPA: YceI family protein [Candidatus Acidoferrales bacterium]|nr:YceI family protein [Candidatus Acidoferrales bacterium]
MAKWRFEPGHTAAEFSVRHMMGTYVRGHFKNIHGTLEFDPEHPENGAVGVTIDAAGLWSGEPERDAHLRSADFLDVERHKRINFKSTRVEPTARNEYKVTGDLTIRGVSRPVTLDVRYMGKSRSPFDDTRAGFVAEGRINRHDWNVNWNSDMKDGGVVVGGDVLLRIDAEAILESA